MQNGDDWRTLQQEEILQAVEFQRVRIMNVGLNHGIIQETMQRRPPSTQYVSLDGSGGGLKLVGCDTILITFSRKVWLWLKKLPNFKLGKQKLNN